MKFTYIFYLFYTNSNDKIFGRIGLQIENTFILANNIFAATKKKRLKKAKLLVKDREKLILNTLIKLNRGYISLADDNNLFFSQKK